MIVQALQKGYQRHLLVIVEEKRSDEWRKAGIEPSAGVVKIDDLFERGEASIVHVGCREGHIAERRSSAAIFASSRGLRASPTRYTTPFASHQAISSSRAKPESPRTQMFACGHSCGGCAPRCAPPPRTRALSAGAAGGL
jgi:hypothetical protein